MEFETSRTRENLQVALAGESQNATVSRQMKKHVKLQDRGQAVDFEADMQLEKDLARQWFEVLNEGPVNGTLASLHEAAAQSGREWSTLYRDWAAVAEEEGYQDLASQFRQAAETREQAAKNHEQWLAGAHGTAAPENG
ncbi:hypothetical protein [uncultured Faecalibaculum sp.]|uniref:hypothetical protein n=1 Tax=uncultured Faecalibaculum sp. TaxID=1729681 RepID=UPI0026151A36|nr:hypothetical protein [uncultured Faecalibaculum sp.]